MIKSDANQTPVADGIGDACWRRIGVQGDRSCPRLPEVVHCHNCPVFSAAGQLLFQRDAPAEYVEEWTRRLAEPEEEAVVDSLALLVFRIGPEWLALDARRAVEVVPPRPIHRVPHRTDRLVLGMANIRGELQLCIALSELLGIDATEGESAPTTNTPTGTKQRLLVAELDQNRWVFPVDQVDGVHHVAAGAMQGLPHTVERSPRFYTQAIFSHEDKRVGLLAESRLFQALERTVR